MNVPTAKKPIQSPCIGLCQLGADGLCDGCLRSGDEIARWMSMSERERLVMMEHTLPAREAVRG